MSPTPLVTLSAGCALAPAALFLLNTLLYRQPKRRATQVPRRVSVLIPARNEERSIETAIRSALSSRNIEFEVLVLDDASTDRTSEIAAALAREDARVRVEQASPLPAGWNGKQHACHLLAALARYETLCFLDADVRLGPQALADMASFLDDSRAALVSGFPQQETGTFLEWLLLPLIHFVLLAYLPIAAMRLFTAPGFAAGCGQFMLVDRKAYERCGGHAAIRTTMHDGILLPKLLRKSGYHTDIADMTELAVCRMYHSAKEVWSGLAKNATEGLAAPSRIVLFTFLLLMGQIAPVILAVALLLRPGLVSPVEFRWLWAAVVASFLPRLLAAVRFRQRWISALLHPIGVAVLLALQWYALIRKLTGQPATWKQRAYNAG